MECIKGKNLGEFIKDTSQCQSYKETMEGPKVIHGEGIRYRDLKPQVLSLTITTQDNKM